MISFLLYEPQALHTLCGIIKAPHLLHFTKFGADIFQLALLLSLLDLEDLFLGQIDISFHLLFVIHFLLQHFLDYINSRLLCQQFFCESYLQTRRAVSLAIASSSLVGTTHT